MLMPGVVTATSMRPSEAWARCTNAATSSPLAASARDASAVPPPARIAAAVASARARSRSAQWTAAPSAPSASAAALPIPEAAPRTSALRPRQIEKFAIVGHPDLPACRRLRCRQRLTRARRPGNTSTHEHSRSAHDRILLRFVPATRGGAGGPCAGTCRTVAVVSSASPQRTKRSDTGRRRNGTDGGFSILSGRHARRRRTARAGPARRVGRRDSAPGRTGHGPGQRRRAHVLPSLVSLDR